MRGLIVISAALSWQARPTNIFPGKNLLRLFFRCGKNKLRLGGHDLSGLVQITLAGDGDVVAVVVQVIELVLVVVYLLIIEHLGSVVEQLLEVAYAVRHAFCFSVKNKLHFFYWIYFSANSDLEFMIL